MIYLDSASTTPMHSEVVSEMIPYLTTQYGNPNSIHSLGIEARKAVDKAREQVAAAINAEPKQIVFTSGGSEANNMVIHGIKKAFPSVDYMSSRMEHTSTLKALEAEAKAVNKSVVSFIEDVGEYDYDAAWGTLIWQMFVNNEVGKVNDVYNIGEKCIGNDNLLFGTDCVQAFGFERIDVKEMKCDFATVSAHKIHGPKGVGALFIRDEGLIEPIINGGINQEFGMRGGTENVAGIVGFGKACEIAESNREENRRKILYLRNLFLENLDGIDYKVNCNSESKILSVQFPKVDSETLVLLLAASEVAVSSGSACRNRESHVNSVLTTYGLSDKEARNTIRISFMDDNTEEEVIVASQVISKTIKESYYRTNQF